MFFKTFLIITAPLLLFGNCVAADHEEIEKGQIRFELVRQKSSTEQILNYGHYLGAQYKDLYKGNRDNDSIALYRFLDDQFYGKIVMGHPGQGLNVAFDTTWSYSWVLSSQCSSIKTVGCWFHSKYDHSKSSEYRKDGRPFSMDLGSYNVTGFYSFDNISIAHSNVTNQSFIEMVTVPNSFIFNKASGVLGLGMKIDQYDPFFYTLLKQKKVKNPMFSVYLNRDTQSKRGGNVMLGFIDDKHIHKTRVKNQSIPDNFTYLPVDNGLTYWQFTMDKVIVDIKNPANKDEEPLILCKDSCKAVPDTSSNSIVGPKEEISELHEKIGAREFFMDRYTVDCDTVNKLPKIMFVLAGKNFTLSGPNYTVKMSYHSLTLCVSAFVPATTVQEKDRWLLGGAFLAEYYSVYNINDKTVGFVKAS